MPLWVGEVDEVYFWWAEVSFEWSLASGDSWNWCCWHLLDWLLFLLLLLLSLLLVADAYEHFRFITLVSDHLQQLLLALALLELLVLGILSEDLVKFLVVLSLARSCHDSLEQSDVILREPLFKPGFDLLVLHCIVDEDVSVVRRLVIAIV